jgi:tetratricopeptide (TPR) repeat protein
MSELWIVCAIVFAGVALAVQALYRIVSRAQRDRNTIKRRLTASAGEGARRTSIEVLRQERGLANFDHPRLAALDEFLVQTGLRISVLMLGLSALSLSVACRFGYVAVSVPSVDGRRRRPQDAVEKSPEDVMAWIGLAASYDRLGRFDLADHAYGAAAKLEGETPRLINNEGYSYMLRGDLKAARAKFHQALKLDPNNQTTLNKYKIDELEPEFH